MNHKLLCAILIFSILDYNALASQTKTNNELGYDILVNGDYIGCGIPVSVMERAIAGASLAPRSFLEAFLPIGATTPFSPSGIKRNNELNENISTSFNRFKSKRGVDVVNFNCLSCHAEIIDGQTVIGLGNTTRDFTQPLARSIPFLKALSFSDLEKEEMAVFERAMKSISPFVQTKTIGVNPAINLTYALLAYRDPNDFSWSDTFVVDPPNVSFPPVDVPPWWRMGRKSRMFYNGEFADNHSYVMTLASTLCVDDGIEMMQIVDKFKDVEGYIKSIKAPKYPLPIDFKKAMRGKATFDMNCAGCHGTYGENSQYPERYISVEIVNTDPWLMESQNGYESERFRDIGSTFFETATGKKIELDPKLGYLAPPLDGIWATAPFLHNGSVPSMEALLKSSIRPKYWRRSFDPNDYDIERMGWKYEELWYGQRLALPLKKRFIYDTTIKGYGNQGHTFGDRLSDIERSEIIEYLKTL